MKLANVYSFLNKDLLILEEKLKEAIDAEHPILRDTSLQLVNAGGKRIRPIFVLLAASFGEYEANKTQILDVAVSLELIHMATLVHDDVVDNATLRRGQPTIKQLYGNRVAMYSGDYLLARSLEIITKIKEPLIHRTLANTLVQVVEGEFAQLEDLYKVEQNLRDYLRRIKRKTALLLATSSRLGAIAAGLAEEEIKHITKYGYYVGMSFQIIDDILDFTASKEEMGKPTANDLAQGNITLPTYYAMQNEQFKKKLINLFQHPEDICEKEFSQLISLLHETDAIQQSYELSDMYLNKALVSLEYLPNNRNRAVLTTIVNYLRKRRS